MASTLTENANGRYYQNLAILTGRPNWVKVIVEDELDVPFWQDILSFIKPQKTFDITPYTCSANDQSDLTKGKQHILKIARENNFNANYIGCVDSDYDYLLSATSIDGQTINNNVHVMQTYAYSIENLMCYPETLDLLCSKATKEKPIFKISEYIESVSRIVYPLLIWSLFLESKDNIDFSPGKWDDIFPCERHICSTQTAPEDILNSLKNNVEETLTMLKTAHQQETMEMNNFEQQLISTYDITPENCYLYVRGHDIHKFILKAILEGVQKESKARHCNEIRQSAATSQEIENRINHYRTVTTDICQLLNVNYEYKHYCSLFQLIQQDVNNIFIQET